VKDLENMGLWEKVKGAIVENQGDIANIEGIPQYIKDIYKTSFSVSPLAFVEVAARAQKWVDQALSRNIYLETRDIDETMAIYTTAWRKGLKSTYYLHMKPRHTAEQSTVKVNKAEKMGKRGFGGVATAPSMPIAVEVEAIVTEPARETYQSLSALASKVAPVAKISSVEASVSAESKRKVMYAKVGGGLTNDPSEGVQCDSCQ
jgi:ribonucleoside-diphosphate reductase alpha chain